MIGAITERKWTSAQHKGPKCRGNRKIRVRIECKLAFPKQDAVLSLVEGWAILGSA
jgi:hypothetical protein